MAHMTGPVEVLEGGTTRPERHPWVLALVVVALLGCGGLWFRQWSAAREMRQAVELTTAFGVDSSSTSPPGGEVSFYVLVRNAGTSPVSVTSVTAADGGLRLRMRDAGPYRIGVGSEAEIVLSARVTCADGVDPTGPLPASLGVRRQDGSALTSRVQLRPASLVLDVAATLCETRPALRDHELSGPVSRPE
jgi:hypothetical protein